jgi:hypothetical protein
VRKIKFDIEKAQEMLDNGLTRNKTASELGIHHSYIIRAIEYGILYDDYFPFDEVEDTRHLAQNFEWLWEEEKLEELVNEAYDNYFVVLDKSLVEVGVYVRNEYGSLFNYLRDKKVSFLSEFIHVRCSRCECTHPLVDWFSDARAIWGLNYSCKKCVSETQFKWNEENRDKIFGYNIARREMAEALPGEYNPEVWQRVRNDYGWKCAVSNSMSVAIDHFIPVAIGHGGTYRENLIPMDKRLNTKKKHHHPEKLIKYGASEERFAQAVNNLAKLNGLTEKEYESFVDWCFANPRTIDEVKRDQRYSIEIWQEATGIQFPLPEYASGGEKVDEKESD